MTSVDYRHFERPRSADVRHRDAIDDAGAKHYLDQRINDIIANRAVDHPFLNRYASEGLGKRGERILFSECFYFFRWLPFYIAGMANQTRDEVILREITLNVADEVGDGTTKPLTHSTIYKQFLAAIGIAEDEVALYEPLPETLALNDGIRKLYTESPIVKGLGALYADETMSAIMVGKLNEGLKTTGYDEGVRFFWLLHMDAEVGHSNSVFNAIHPYVSDPANRAAFERGTEEFLGLVETYWDAVERRIAHEVS